MLELKCTTIPSLFFFFFNNNYILLTLRVFMPLHAGMCTTERVYRSKNNKESILSLHHVGPGIQLRLSGIAGAFTIKPPCQPTKLFFVTSPWNDREKNLLWSLRSSKDRFLGLLSDWDLKKSVPRDSSGQVLLCNHISVTNRVRNVQPGWVDLLPVKGRDVSRRSPRCSCSQTLICAQRLILFI